MKEKGNKSSPASSLFCSFLFTAALFLMLHCCINVNAAIIQKPTSDGTSLHGSEIITSLENRYSEKLNIPDSDPGDYMVNISISFNDPQHAPAKLPDQIVYSIDTDQFTMYNTGNAIYADKRTIKSISPAELFLSFYLDDDDALTGNYKEYIFSLDFTIQKVPVPTPAPSTPKPQPQTKPAVQKSPKVTLHPNSISPLYSGDNDTMQLEISDPELPYWEYIKPNQVSVSFSYSSIVSLTKKDFFGNSLQLHIRALKSGSTKCTVSYKGVAASQVIKVQNTTYYVPSTASMTLKQKKNISNYVSQMGLGKCVIKNIKSNRKSVLAVSGKKLIAKKPGKATITFTLNGKRKAIKFTVQKPAPKLSQLKVKISNYKYYHNSCKTYYYLTFKNTSQRTITKVKLRYTMTLNETITLTKTHKVNIKPGATKKVKVYVGKLITDPQSRKVKCLKLWYK